MDHTPCKLPHVTYTLEVSLLNLHHVSYFTDLTPWMLPHGTYIMEVTSRILQY